MQELTPVLEITNLTKVYPGGRAALEDLSLRLEGGVFGLLGPNGAGKTTLLEILALEREPEKGSVRCAGILAWENPRAWRRILGVVPQHYGFVSHLTGRETLELTASLAGLSWRRVGKRIDDLLARMRLTWAAGRKVEAYSRGMRQRLGIAVSLLSDPVLWLLDEPTSGLDPEERVSFRELLAEEGRRRITVLSTHIVEDVERCCSRMGVLNRGRILFEGMPSELIHRSREQVWEWKVRSDELDRWAADPRVVTVRALGEGAFVRCVASTPPSEAAQSVTPTLEDAYLNLVGGLKAAQYEEEENGKVERRFPSGELTRSRG